MLYKLRKIVNNDFDYYTLRICILIYCSIFSAQYYRSKYCFKFFQKNVLFIILITWEMTSIK